MSDTDSTSSANSTPWQAQSATRITRPTSDGLVEQISDDGNGRFTRRFLATPGHFAPRLVQALDPAHLKALQAQLQAQVPASASAQLATGEASNLRQFMGHIDDALRNQPSA